MSASVTDETRQAWDRKQHELCVCKVQIDEGMVEAGRGFLLSTSNEHRSRLRREVRGAIGKRNILHISSIRPGVFGFKRCCGDCLREEEATVLRVVVELSCYVDSGCVNLTCVVGVVRVQPV